MPEKDNGVVLRIIVLVAIVAMLICGNGLYQNKKLFDAVENNDLAAAHKAIRCGAWVNTRKHMNLAPIVEIIFSNPTPLEKACMIGNQEMVVLLLENGANVNKGNKQTQSTPLLYSLHGTKSNRFALAMYLIESGADIYNLEQAKILGEKLIYISREDNEETVQEGFLLFQYLMEKNVPLEIHIGTENLLTFAARYNNYNVVRYLIEEGYFDVNGYDYEQNTALIVATKFENFEMVELLLELGADVLLIDASGKTAVDYAVELDNNAIVSMLS